MICDSPRQPSGPFPRPWCPCLQWSQRSPSTLALHRHWPEIIPAATSVRASHSPPCRDPSGSQLQAARRQCTRPAQGRFTHTRKLAHCVETRKRSHDYCQGVLGTCRRTLGAEGCTQKVTVPLSHISANSTSRAVRARQTPAHLLQLGGYLHVRMDKIMKGNEPQRRRATSRMSLEQRERGERGREASFPLWSRAQ